MALEKRKEEVVAQLSPLAVIDYVLEEVLGLPGIGDILVTPRDIADVLDLPTPDTVVDELRKKLVEKVRAKVR